MFLRADMQIQRFNRLGSLHAPGPRHFHQARDALFGRRMSREQLRDAAAGQRIHDHHLGGGGMLLGRWERDARSERVNLLERARERLRVAQARLIAQRQHAQSANKHADPHPNRALEYTMRNLARLLELSR